MRCVRLMIATIVMLLLVVGGQAELVTAGGEYLCYRAAPARAERDMPLFPEFTPRVGDVVVDALGSAGADDQHLRDFKKAIGLCVPADMSGQGVAESSTHLEGYAVTRTHTIPRQRPPLVGLHEIANQFGTLRLAVRGADRVLVPAAATSGTAGAPTPVPGDVDTFACYPAAAVHAAADAPAFSPRTVTVQDGLATRTLELSKLTRVCAPADVDGADPSALTHAAYLACYRARLARTAVPQPLFARTLVSTQNVFGSEVLVMTAIEELCIPSAKDPPHPTTTPLVLPSALRTGTPRMVTFTPARTPTVARTATPTRTVTPKATRTATVGATPTLTPSPTPSQTPPPTKTPPPTRSATPKPTRSATPTLSPTPVGTPQRLLVMPAARTIQDEASTNFTALAQFRNGATQNYTQKVTWTSSNDAIATVSNDPGMHGRVTGHRPGSVTLSVSDPVSGLASAKADNGTLTVLGRLTRITLAPSEASLRVGDQAVFTATGHFDGGTTENVTQKVNYSSSDPAVAVATNTEGNRSLVDAVGDGTAVITATDPDTGITSSTGGGDATLTVGP